MAKYDKTPIFGITREQWMHYSGRALARYIVIPLNTTFNVLMHSLGIAFLIRFGLGVAGSARLDTTDVGELSRFLTNPFLAPAWLWLAEFQNVPADTIQAVPVIFAIAAWALRASVSDRLTTLSDRLQGRKVENLFKPGRLRVVPPKHAAKTKDLSFEQMEEYARLVPSATQAQDADGNQSTDFRLGSIGFDSAARIQVIGRYELLQELGRGPMGVVYKAFDLQIGRSVVLKVLSAREMDEEELRLKKLRLFKEARAAGKLVHAGLVTIFDVAEDEQGNPYIVMEYVEGETLEDALTPRFGKQLLNLNQRLDVAIEIAHAVDYAHCRGIIHRDLKPANVLLTADLHTKVVDFGIARLIEASEEDDGVPGTPEFVAPELLKGLAAGRSSDIFSLGVMLYWIFTGELPFSGRSVTEITYNVAHNQPAPVRQLNWALPKELDALLRRCLAKDPGARYSSAGELAADLQVLRYTQNSQGIGALSNDNTLPRALAG